MITLSTGWLIFWLCVVGVGVIAAYVAGYRHGRMMLALERLEKTMKDITKGQ